MREAGACREGTILGGMPGHCEEVAVATETDAAGWDVP